MENLNGFGILSKIKKLFRRSRVMAAPANTESEEENLHSTTSFSDREASVLLQSQESFAVKKEDVSQSHSHQNTDEDEPKESSCHLGTAEEIEFCRGLDSHSEASKHGISLEDGGENKAAPLKRLYEIKTSAGKGLGVFAIEDMKRGTRIMCEKPLLSTLCKDVSQIPATFASLSPSAQVLYRTLSYPKANLRDPATVTSLHDHPECLNAVASMSAEDYIIIMAIHRVNAYGASDGSVICLEASRINHSCVPNVQHNWNSRLGALTIHARVKILLAIAKSGTSGAAAYKRSTKVYIGTGSFQDSAPSVPTNKLSTLSLKL
ncbi:MAG: hypothetical protein Q9202_000031 [Teloschistes flavicans]